MIRIIYLRAANTTPVERGDIITLAAGIAIVVIMALVLKFGGLFHDDEAVITEVSPLPTGPATGTRTFTPDTESPVTPTLNPVTTPATPVPTPSDPVPYRIYYTDNPLAYPVFRLPESMNTFGASEIPWKDPGIVSFAYLDESRSGLTQKFRIPYGVWGMNISVEARIKPQYALFDMALCNATDGKYIDAIEIAGHGTAFRNIQVSNRDMYLIIHIENVERFKITFLTPRIYYNSVMRT